MPHVLPYDAAKLMLLLYIKMFIVSDYSDETILIHLPIHDGHCKPNPNSVD